MLRPGSWHPASPHLVLHFDVNKTIVMVATWLVNDENEKGNKLMAHYISTETNEDKATKNDAVHGD